MTSIQQNSPIKKLKIIRHNDTHVTVQQRNKEFVLVSLKDYPRVRSCGGCSYQLLKSYPPPDDIAIALKEYDSSRDAQTGVLRRSNNLANRYYQPNRHCVRKGNNGANKNFQFTDLDISTVELEDAHKILHSKNYAQRLLHNIDKVDLLGSDKKEVPSFQLNNCLCECEIVSPQSRTKYSKHNKEIQ